MNVKGDTNTEEWTVTIHIHTVNCIICGMYQWLFFSGNWIGIRYTVRITTSHCKQTVTLQMTHTVVLKCAIPVVCINK